MNPIVINRKLRLTNDQFYSESFPKKQIYIHHTVGGSAQSSFNYWQTSPERIGTAYIIDRDGTIYETFPPTYWAHHLGLHHKRNTELNQQSVGIEIASEGALTMVDGVLRAFDGKTIFKSSYIDNGKAWRGYQYFDVYEPEQIKSLYILIQHLCEQLSIPKKCIKQDVAHSFDEHFFDFNGILGHCNVREDKSDPHPHFRFDFLQAFLDGADLGTIIQSQE